MIIHTVKPGETAYSIAEEYGVSPSLLIAQNALLYPSDLVVGQTIVVLFPSNTYTVQENDTLFSIAAQSGISVNQLQRNNPQLRGGSNLYPGQTLVLDYEEAPKLGTIAVNGYAYAYIDTALLRSVLPYLTYLTLFTYGFRPDGTLIDINDRELIALAREYGTSPLMHLSSLTESGQFSNELSRALLENPSAQQALIQSVLSVIRERGYDGVDIDFEYVFADDAPAYVAFVQKLTEALNAEGYITVVALAPKTSIGQPGLLYEGHDYAGLGNAANAALLMTYEWGYTYGPPMAVAPIRNVQAVIDFAVTQIPAGKLFLGIPNYGYDWSLPFVAGESKARSISNVSAVEIARRTGSIIRYDNEAQSPFFTYNEDGVDHEVWFEDANSIAAKLRLPAAYGMLGASYWNVMRPFPQNWLVLNSLYQIQRGPTIAG